MTFLALFGVLRRGSALAAKFLKLADVEVDRIRTRLQSPIGQY
jgi:hypothetical protein